MTTYVALSFHPTHKNPARANGRGVYRVMDCWVDGRLRSPDWQKPIRVCQELLILHATRPYKRGSRVDPLKIALAARQAAV